MGNFVLVESVFHLLKQVTSTSTSESGTARSAVSSTGMGHEVHDTLQWAHAP